MFKYLIKPNCLRIPDSFITKGMCVFDVITILGLIRSTTSRHLAMLKNV